MKKQFIRSKTVWGAILIGLEAAFLALGMENQWAHALAGGIGAFLTVYGFRDAMK